MASDGPGLHPGSCDRVRGLSSLDIVLQLGQDRDLCLPQGLVRPLKGHSRPGTWPHPPGARPGRRVPSVVGMGWGPPRGGEVGPQLTQGPLASSTQATQPPARLSEKQASRVEARVPASLQEEHRPRPLACPPLSIIRLSNAGPSRKLVGLARKNSSRAYSQDAPAILPRSGPV